jgi:hypothetical protein
MSVEKSSRGRKRSSLYDCFLFQPWLTEILSLFVTVPIKAILGEDHPWICLHCAASWYLIPYDYPDEAIWICC